MGCSNSKNDIAGGIQPPFVRAPSTEVMVELTTALEELGYVRGPADDIGGKDELRTALETAIAALSGDRIKEMVDTMDATEIEGELRQLCVPFKADDTEATKAELLKRKYAELRSSLWMPSLKRMATLERAKACELIEDEYEEAIEQCDEAMLSSLEGLNKRHHYQNTTSKGDGSKALKAILKELRKELPKCLKADSTAGILVRFDEDKPRYLQACLLGVQGTPYESGAFIFDIFIPDTYPQTNCLITHTTKNAGQVHANNGPGGFSPNLHQATGKVCLSLLGTWQGPGWQADKSNVYHALSTILFSILGAEHPYYMEPGHGGWEGTAPTTNHKPEVIEYDERVKYGTAKYAILDQMTNPPKGFEEALKAHFLAKRHVIVQTIQSWIDKGSPSSKAQLTPVLAQIKAQLHTMAATERNLAVKAGRSWSIWPSKT